MKKRKYIYTNKKQSQRAIMSTILGIISLVSLVLVIYFTYQRDGVTTGGYGMTGVWATIFSLVGEVLGIITLRDKDNYRFFPILGTLLNGVVLIGIFFLLYLGRMQ